MRGKKLLAAILLGVVLCFVPALGYGEVILGPRITIGEMLHVLKKEPLWPRMKVMYTDIDLLQGRVSYMMTNPANFLNVVFFYDPDGRFREFFPEGVDTKGKIYVLVTDNRDVFSYKSGIALRDEFKRHLEVIYSFIPEIATDMDADVVAKFYSKGGIPLGYFYQGEYHLWEK